MTSPHLDDDALSALLDDEPDGRLAAHVATCGVCTDRLASFRGARAALRTEDALDELTRRRLIQRALDAYDGTSVAAPARRSRSWARVVTVAAAALVLIGGFGVLATTTRHPNRSVASRADIAHVRNLGDLGDVSDPTTLRSRLSATDIESAPAAADSASGAPAAGFTAKSAGPGSVAPEEAPVPSPARSPVVIPTDRFDACVTALRHRGNPGHLSLRASGTYDGHTVIVLGFTRVAASRTRLVAFVVDPRTCEIEHSQVV